MSELDTKVTVEGRAISIKEILEINQQDLNNEFATQAARYAYFGVLAANAQHAWFIAKNKSKELYSALFAEAKADQNNIPAGGRTVSDSTADSLVLLDPEYIEIQQAELDAQLSAQILKVLADSFDQRSRMLHELGNMAANEQRMTGMQVDTEDLKKKMVELKQSEIVEKIKATNGVSEAEIPDVFKLDVEEPEEPDEEPEPTTRRRRARTVKEPEPKAVDPIKLRPTEEDEAEDDEEEPEEKPRQRGRPKKEPVAEKPAGRIRRRIVVPEPEEEEESEEETDDDEEDDTPVAPVRRRGRPKKTAEPEPEKEAKPVLRRRVGRR